VTKRTLDVLRVLVNARASLTGNDISTRIEVGDGRAVTASLVSLEAYGYVEAMRRTRYPRCTWKATDKGRTAYVKAIDTKGL
jgi:predicted ArsR family transcriptional regulator